MTTTTTTKLIPLADWMEPELLLMYSFVDAADMLTMMVRITVLIAVVLTVPLTHFPVSCEVTWPRPVVISGLRNKSLNFKDSVH